MARRLTSVVLVVSMAGFIDCGKCFGQVDQAARLFQDFYDRADAVRYRVRPPIGTDLHAVLVIDTNAHNAAGLGIVADGVHFVSLLESLFPDKESGNHKLATLKVLSGDDVSDRKIIDAIQALPSKPTDTLLFFYSGHGGTYSTVQTQLLNNQITPQGLRYDFDSAHFFAMSSGVANRSDVKSAMASRPGQLRIILSDCCANYSNRQAARAAIKGPDDRVTTTTPQIIEESERSSVKVQSNPALTSAIFFESVGWVSINAAPPSQTTPGRRDGGVFANGLMRNMSTLAQFMADNPGLAPDTWRQIGEVQIRKIDPREPIPNPGGATPGMQKPGFIYSYIFASSTPLFSINP